MDKQPERQPIFAEIASLDAIYHGAQEPEQLAAHVMVRDENWKYVWNRFDIDELYDLSADPGEMKNVASDSDQRNRAASMRETNRRDDLPYRSRPLRMVFT